MSLYGLHLDATEAWAVGGTLEIPATWPLAGSGCALAMAVSLETRRLSVGQAGAALVREYPHLVCRDFLAALETDRSWRVGRRCVTASRALALVFESIRRRLVDAKAVVVVVPPYLNALQAAQVKTLAQKSKIPVVGTVPAPFAWAMAVHAQKALPEMVLVIDVDDHALSWSLVRIARDQARVVEQKSLPSLSAMIWKERLLDGIATTCIHHNRRDFRDSGRAEQGVWDQIDAALERVAVDQTVEFIIRASSWCQNLILQPAQFERFCAELLDRAIEELTSAFERKTPECPGLVLMSHRAALLPGLFFHLHHEVPRDIQISPLSEDSAAMAARSLAARWPAGESHLDTVCPLPKPKPQTVGVPAGKHVIPITSADR